MTSPGTAGAGARDWTPIDRLADEYVERSADLDPVGATMAGVAGRDHLVTDYSPAGHAARADLDRRTLADLHALPPVDEVDRTTVLTMSERLEAGLALAAAGEDLGVLNVIDSPVQWLRQVFDVQPTATAEAVEALTQRLAAVPTAVAGWLAAVDAAASAGRPPARRQVLACLAQCDEIIGEDGFFASFARDVLARPDAASWSPARRRDLAAAADLAATGYRDLAGHLEERVLHRSTDVDAVGRDRYALWSRQFVGEDIDLDEAYAWGLDQVARLQAEAQALASSIVPGGDVAAAVAALDADPDRRPATPEAFRDWLQAVSDETIAALSGTQFHIEPQARRLDCRLAPTSSGGVYYSGPSEDFSRPGTMWWALPDGRPASTWSARTVVHHEGAPGHHLQTTAVALQRDSLNRYRRTSCWVSGHGEGWALYAERLMAELGFLADPGDRLGLLTSQLLRATRVVVDIGLHCGLAPPAELGGSTWTAESAWTYLYALVPEPEAVLRFELDRYLGWPGQAPSYALGERVWLQLRDAARAGPGHDPVAWHRQVLELGSMGLGPLRQIVGG